MRFWGSRLERVGEGEGEGGRERRGGCALGCEQTQARGAAPTRRKRAQQRQGGESRRSKSRRRRSWGGQPARPHRPSSTFRARSAWLDPCITLSLATQRRPEPERRRLGTPNRPSSLISCRSPKDAFVDTLRQRNGAFQRLPFVVVEAVVPNPRPSIEGSCTLSNALHAAPRRDAAWLLHVVQPSVLACSCLLRGKLFRRSSSLRWGAAWCLVGCHLLGISSCCSTLALSAHKLLRCSRRDARLRVFRFAARRCRDARAAAPGDRKEGYVP